MTECLESILSQKCQYILDRIQANEHSILLDVNEWWVSLYQNVSMTADLLNYLSQGASS